MKHQPAIDGLRAIAVLAVVGYHVGLVPAGYVGVDVFFVISGYLITGLLAEEERIDFVAFYARRARRILPALVVVILATLIASTFVLSPIGEQQRAAESAAASLLFAGNLWFQAHTGGYFDPSTDKMPFLHLWSLGVEEQFYLVWPVVLFLSRRKPVVALAALSGASLLLAEAWLYSGSQAAFYAMPARAWELGIGGLIALGGSDGKVWQQLVVRRAVRREQEGRGGVRGDGHEGRMVHGDRDVQGGGGQGHAGGRIDRQVCGAAGLCLTLAACLVPLPHFPGLGALPAVLGAALVIVGQPRLLTTRPLVAVGLISYSLYLWHWPALALLRASSVGVPPLSDRLLAVGVAFGLAIASYRYVETPFRRMRGRKRIVMAGAACSLILSLAAFTYSAKPAGPSMREAIAAYAAQDKSRSGVGCDLSNESANVTPPCKPEAVTLWGDSMALAWEPFAQELARKQGMKASSMSRHGCPPALFQVSDRKYADTCLAFNRHAFAVIQQGKVDTLILAGWWREYPEYRTGLPGLVKAVKPYVRRVLVIDQTPMLKDPAPDCYAQHKDCGITRAAFEADRQAIHRDLQALGVELVDPSTYLCVGDFCPAVRDGIVLYWDDHHPTAKAATAFGLKYQGTGRSE